VNSFAVDSEANRLQDTDETQSKDTVHPKHADRSFKSTGTEAKVNIRSSVIGYLDAGLGEVDLQGHLLPHEDVRVARLREQRLQDVQLRPGERGALPALLARRVCKQESAAIKSCSALFC